MASRIALVARRKSGKSTVAEMIARHGYDRAALALPVKEGARDMLNDWLAWHYPGSDGRTITMSDIDRDKAVFRPLLEWFGATFVRDYLGLPTYWIDELRDGLTDDGNYVVDDMRMPNEADELRRMGFVVVRVVRPESERLAALRAAGEPEGPMPSEAAIDEIVPDATIVNAGTLAELEANVARLLRSLD